jgi:hypothetical protein
MTARGHSAPCHRRPHLRQSSSSTDTPLYRSIDVSGLRGPSHFQHRIGSYLREGLVWSFTILQAYAPPREVTYRRNPECARQGFQHEPNGSNHATTGDGRLKRSSLALSSRAVAQQTDISFRAKSGEVPRRPSPSGVIDWNHGSSSLVAVFPKTQQSLLFRKGGALCTFARKSSPVLGPVSIC